MWGIVILIHSASDPDIPSDSDFQISFMSAQLCGERLKTKFSVKNTGKQYPGKEVVQIYYSAPGGKLDKPVKELIAFQKTPLIDPGQSAELSIEFNVRDMASYSQEDAAWILEKGEYHILAGNCSSDLFEIASVSAEKDITVRTCRNVFAPDAEMQEIKCVKRPEKFYQMAEMCVGTLREDNGSVVGNASDQVPGAAGDTSTILADTRGIPGIIMADGPAGLRLEPHFQITENGKNIDCYQFCTAIPIGWALAQSWNTELAEKTGYMVGTEMEEFHIDLWLAPAFNIHRNPLCGRNFEYYSEDPVVSGMIAASVTKGVQRHKGKGTTIKHFAANNQEDNRYFLNAHVSERAMREIYLKAFEIAVKAEQPAAFMTSYNLINGIHAANSKDLIQYILRDEWGFEGLVMTDWFTSQHLPAFTGKYDAEYPISSSVGCIYAGNDLQMPGCRKNVDDIVTAIREQTAVDGYHISKADLQYCTANIIRAVLRARG